jgi:ferredoxin
MKKIKKIIIDRGLCIGAATCVALAQKAFAIDKENKAIILTGWDQEDAKMILEAAKSCPVSAITIIDEGDQQLWPLPEK